VSAYRRRMKLWKGRYNWRNLLIGIGLTVAIVLVSLWAFPTWGKDIHSWMVLIGAALSAAFGFLFRLF